MVLAVHTCVMHPFLQVSVIKALGAEIVRTPSAASFKNAGIISCVLVMVTLLTCLQLPAICILVKYCAYCIVQSHTLE